MKKLFFWWWIIILISGISWAQESPRGVGFEETAITTGVNFKDYAELYIYGIDVRKMGVKRVDTDGDLYEKPVDDLISLDIAFELNRVFSEQLGKVLPVAQPQEQFKGAAWLKGKNALLLEIKLSYERTIEDVGLLTQFIFKKDENVISEGNLTIVCSFRDSDSGKVVLKLEQTLAFDIENDEQPFSTEKDQEELKNLIKIWAMRSARILANKRGVEYSNPE